jgi:hypothetical protein
MCPEWSDLLTNRVILVDSESGECVPGGATCWLIVLYLLTRNQVNVSEWSDQLTKRVILADSESGQCVRVERPID